MPRGPPFFKTEIQPFLLNTGVSGCCEPLVISRVPKKVDSDHFAGALIASVEGWIFPTDVIVPSNF